MTENERMPEYWDRTGRWPFLVGDETRPAPVSPREEVENIRKAIGDFEKRPDFPQDRLQMMREDLARREAELDL